MLNNLMSNTPKKARKRLGPGIGSGLGKTSGKGHKGQNARSGGGVRPGFEGGQIPLFQRLPKRGFNPVNKQEFAIVKTSSLNKFKDNDTITNKELLQAGLIKKEGAFVKIVNDIVNKLERKGLTIKVKKITKGAEAALKNAGCTCEVI